MLLRDLMSHFQRAGVWLQHEALLLRQLLLHLRLLFFDWLHVLLQQHRKLLLLKLMINLLQLELVLQFVLSQQQIILLRHLDQRFEQQLGLKGRHLPQLQLELELKPSLLVTIEPQHQGLNQDFSIPIPMRSKEPTKC